MLETIAIVLVGGSAVFVLIKVLLGVGEEHVEQFSDEEKGRYEEAQHEEVGRRLARNREMRDKQSIWRQR